MKLQPLTHLLFALLPLLVPGPRTYAGVVVEDHFNTPDGSLAAAVWNPYAGFGAIPSIVNGQVRLDARGSVATVADLNPSINGLKVEATFTVSNDTDITSIVTRANPVGTGTAGSPRDGIQVHYWLENNMVEFRPNINGAERPDMQVFFGDDDNLGNRNSLKGIKAGSTIKMTVFDDGEHLFAKIEHLGGPGSGVGYGAATMPDVTNYDHVVFMNRENSVTMLDDIVITDNVTVPVVPGTHDSSFVLQYDLAEGVPDAAFTSFGNPAMNSEGHLAFLAKLIGSGITSANNQGIWADDASGDRQLVVRSGANAPDATGAAGSAVFKKFGDPVYNGNEAVAFPGTLVVSGTTTTANDTGVWSNDGGTLYLVAREGDAAPGCPAGVVFAQFKQIALPDQGGALLYAKVTGGGTTSASDYGIWAVDTSGLLQLIVREGDPQAVTGRTIKTLSFLPTAAGVTGQTRSFSQTIGDLVYSATFTDGSFGIFKVVFP